jgi:hypothetical protein
MFCLSRVQPNVHTLNKVVTRLVNDGGTTEGRGWFSAFTGDWSCKGVGDSMAVADVCGTSIATRGATG